MPQAQGPENAVVQLESCSASHHRDYPAGAQGPLGSHTPVGAWMVPVVLTIEVAQVQERP